MPRVDALGITYLRQDLPYRLRFSSQDVAHRTRQRPGRDCTGARASTALFDHLICLQQERGRNREAECPGGSLVDDQVELGGLLDGEIGGLGALEDLVDLDSSATILLRDVCPIEHHHSRSPEGRVPCCCR